MNTKKILMALIVTALMMGSVCAASVNDFKVDGYNNIGSSDNNSAFLNDQQNSGVVIYKNIDENNEGGHYEWDNDGYFEWEDDDDGYDDLDDDAYIEFGNDHYDLDDDDTQVIHNADNTANYTDYDDAEHGIVEVVQSGNDQYTVVFWAKDASSINNSDLMAKLTDFNKDNGVAPVAF